MELQELQGKATIVNRRPTNIRHFRCSYSDLEKLLAYHPSASYYKQYTIKGSCFYVYSKERKRRVVEHRVGE